MADAQEQNHAQFQYISGSEFDWKMENGLYNHLKTWKIKCHFILCAELETLSEGQKCKMLFWWLGD